MPLYRFHAPSATKGTKAMPYTRKQKRTFAAAAHDPAIAKRVGISQADARKLQDEAKRTKTKPPVKKK